MYSVFVKSLAGLVVILLVAACSSEPESPETLIRTLVSEFEQSVEDGNLKQVGERVSDTYRDHLHADKRAAMRSLFGYTRRNRSIHLLSRVHDVQVDPSGDTASAVVFVAMTGVPVESYEALVSVRADMFRFETRFVREDEAWRIASSTWRRVRAADFSF